MSTPASAAPTVLLDAEQIGRTLRRMAHEIVEREGESLDRLALVGIYTRGVTLAHRLAALLAEIGGVEVPVGELDITFYRDDMGLRGGETRAHPQPVVKASSLDFPLDGATVVIVDDVLYTGRTVRAAIEAVFDYGRPAHVRLAVLCDRGHRELPIRADVVGKNLPTSRAERVRVHLGENDSADEVVLERGGGMTAVLSEPALAVAPGTRHLLSSEDLDRATVDRLLELAASFEAVAEREVKKLPTLRGRTVLSVFFEASTRTASSFELAAKRLSADTISLKAGGSSVEKGETLKDTLLTLDAYGPDVVVIRHAQVGAAALATRYTRAAVVNAGDGAHQHPTQSLLDLYTMRAALGRVEGVHVAIVGDVLHSRVARSNLALLLACGAHVTLIGPPSLIPRGIEATGASVSHEIGDIAAADVVYVLRMQRERMLPGEAYVPSLREYTLRYGITAERLRPGQVVMHPGPMNRGVEITDEVADSAVSLVTRQVRAGLVVRMAVLYDLLAGSGAEASA